MKKKKIVMMGITFTILLVAVVALALVQRKNKTLATQKIVSHYEVVENTGAVFKGTSIISDEQSIFVDNTLKVETLHIADKQEVKKDDLIITYFNEAIQDQIDSLELQYDSTNNKFNREYGNKSQTSEDITKKEKSIDEKNNKINTLDEITQIDEITSLQQEIAVEKQELDVLGANLQAEETTVTTLNDTLKELNDQIESLKTKLRKEVKADIDGIAYINKEGLTNPSVQYITIVSKEPLVKGSANEYEVLNLSVGQEMQLKVLSTGETIKGTVTSIDDLPTMSADKAAVAYNFNIKPENNIRIGFSVEIKENINTLEIPKDYVGTEEDKLIVAKVTDNGLEKVEVTGNLDSDYYLISSDVIKPGDKLSINPLDELKEE